MFMCVCRGGGRARLGVLPANPSLLVRVTKRHEHSPAALTERVLSQRRLLLPPLNPVFATSPVPLPIRPVHLAPMKGKSYLRFH